MFKIYIFLCTYVWGQDIPTKKRNNIVEAKELKVISERHPTQDLHERDYELTDMENKYILVTILQNLHEQL
jgi:hypothetical protein